MRTIALLPILLLGCREATIPEDTSDTAADTDTDPGLDTDDGDGETDDTDDTGASCTATLASSDPENLEKDVPIDAVVKVSFSAPVSSGQWVLAVTPGAGSAALATDGLSATWTPAADLDVSTTYTIDASVCGGKTKSTFTTAGPPLDPATLEGRTYALDYDDVTWVEPPGAALFAGSLKAFEYFLIQVKDLDASADTIHVVGAVGADGTSAPVQAACYPPYDYGVADFSTNPVFKVGPADLAFDAGGTMVTLQDLYVEATFAEDGDSLKDVEMLAEIDTRELAGVTSFDLCGLLTCTPCDDGVAKCLPVLLTAKEAAYVPGLSVDLAYDPAADPTCAP